MYRKKIAHLLYYSLLSALLFIAGCSSVHHKDGPPHFSVDETKIPNAIPKYEPLSKYGNMPSYKVFGQRYYVMKSAKHYSERGIASWYGTQFHSHKTSSGEPYNMLAMTAAHKSLPLPTYVQVTNLKNGLKIMVKVNDRGPFAPGRIIDLSYVAAKKLGMLGAGTTFVEVKAIDPRAALELSTVLASNTLSPYQNHQKLIIKHHLDVKSLPHKARLIAPTNYYLQVGTYKNKSNAFQLQKKLQRLFSYKVMLLHAAPLYRVQMGPFTDASTRNILTKKLHALGYTVMEKSSLK